MTNTELIQAIRNEIERRITDNTFGAKLELIDILAWLDTLELEKPVPNDLEEAADSHIRKVADAAGHPGWDWTTQDIADAFIAGAKWQKKQMMKEAEKPCHTVEEWMEHIKNADALTKAIFSKGPYNVLYDALNRPYRDCYDAIKEFGELCYQTARQDMMKEAVEGEAHPDDCEIWVNLVGYGYKFNDGDKVRIIIVKED